MIKSHIRGNEIYYDYNQKKWLYVNDKTSIMSEKPCIRCKNYPTKNGYDSCLGKLKNISNACCGHGVENSYYMGKN